jgi:hypothetical protein
MPQKRKAGRPEAEERKDRRAVILLSTAESELLTETARSERMAFSQWAALTLLRSARGKRR